MKDKVLLEVHGLSVGVMEGRSYLSAVDSVSFNIEEGEILGLAGESGCGKTLTALSIPALLPRAAVITGGDIVYHTQDEEKPAILSLLDENELSRLRGKEISCVYQEAQAALNPLMKAGDQIAEALEIHGFRDRKERKLMALDLLGKLGFDRPAKIYSCFPHQLSGGMCQRVLIGIASICRPRLLIADEPTTALDGKNQAQILSLLGDINKNNNTAILFISHDLKVVRRFCNRILVMYAGKIVEEGPAEKVFSGPQHPYTRGLIGAIPDPDRKGPLANIPGRVPSVKDHFTGCRFAPRCAYAKEPCQRAYPPAVDCGGGHHAYCLFAQDSERSGHG
jgi:oligopeptide/dipeptide ABC transporter ATP-binding protein